MKAMILAAGMGTRLKPITNQVPKALVPVGGYPLLELVIKKLMAAGVDEIVVNLHHFADQIIRFLEKRKNFGIKIHFSYEEEILGTGGGLLFAADYLKGSEPFFLHNVDIVSDINLQEMLKFHKKSASLVTLAVQMRDKDRVLLVDDKNLVCGHEDRAKNLKRIRRQPLGALRRFGFCGIHVISPEIFHLRKFSGYESIIDIYLDLIEQGKLISAFDVSEFYWKDIGKLHTLQEIEDDFQSNKIGLQQLIR